MWYQLRPSDIDLHMGLWFEPESGEFIEIENAHPDILCAVLIKKGHGHVGPKRLKEMMESYPHLNPGITSEYLEKLISVANQKGFENLSRKDQNKLLDAAYFIWETGGISEHPRSTIAILDARCPGQNRRAEGLKKKGLIPFISGTQRQTVIDILAEEFGIKDITY